MSTLKPVVLNGKTAFDFCGVQVHVFKRGMCVHVVELSGMETSGKQAHGNQIRAPSSRDTWLPHNQSGIIHSPLFPFVYLLCFLSFTYFLHI